MVPGQMVLCLVYFTANVRQVPSLIFHSTSEIRCRQLMRQERHTTRSQVPARTVVKQPIRGASSRTTVTTIVQTGGDWSTGLFSVCRDRKICFCGLFCPVCLEYDIARHYGECLCWPLLPGSTFALRTGTRERHKIQGTLCEDWMVVHCCWPFSICQVARELKMRTSQLYEICAIQAPKASLV